MPASTDERRPRDEAPADLELPNQLGAPVKLADFAGRIVVLFFYPQDDTPGCTIEGREFRDLHGEFLAHDCVVLGASVDPVESHRAFAEKHGFPFHLLADVDGRLAAAFGALREGRAERATFVIGPQGRIRHAFRNVNPRGHAQQVLNFVLSLRQSQAMLGG